MTEEQAAKPQRNENGNGNGNADGNDRPAANHRSDAGAARPAGAGQPDSRDDRGGERQADAGVEMRGTNFREQDRAAGWQDDGAAQLREGAAGEAERLAELEARCSALQDQYLRAVAEAENVRRRAQEDVAKAHKYGIEGFAEALLPVLDSLELALKTDSPSIENMREGVEATLRLFGSVFEKNRLTTIDPAGEKFDPNLHQAISMVPGNAVNPPVPPNHVVSVLQKGYLINDRVLRPALVTVAEA